MSEVQGGPGRPQQPPSPSALDTIAQASTRITELAERMVRQAEASSRAERQWKWIRRLGLGLVVALSMMMYLTWYSRVIGLSTPSVSLGQKVAMVTVSGAIASGRPASADRLVPLITKACRSRQVGALVLRVRSPGGDPSESARIGEAVRVCQEADKPVVSYIDGVGASGGYLVAIQADEVHADRYAYVGSIGAVATLWGAGDLLGRMGLHERVFVSGDLKAPFTWTHEGDEQAQAYMQHLVDTVAGRFLADVQSRRGATLNLPVSDLASGRVWLAEEALAHGLIDGVSNLDQLIHSRWPDWQVHHFRHKEPLLGGLGVLHEAGRQVADGVRSGLRTPADAQARPQ